jgi:hypothetical protein
MILKIKDGGVGVFQGTTVQWPAFFLAMTLALAASGTADAADDSTISGTLIAQSLDRTPAGFFAMMDDNKDQRVDRAEFRFQKMQIYFLRDANQDDKLSREELPYVSKTAFGAADANRDGTLSGYEFNQAGFAKFEALDRNKDGFITLDEVRAYVRNVN